MEIIKRKCKCEIEKITEPDKVVQFSYNDFGHLTIRIFKRENKDEDILIVLDTLETSKLVVFLNSIGLLRTRHDC